MAGDKATPTSILDLKSKYESVVVACNRCGFCTSYCPTYNASGSELHTPRGRNQIFRTILEGKLEDPLGAREIIDSCLLCGECTTICFAEIPTAQLMVHARHLLNRSAGVSFGLQFIVNGLLQRPGLLYWAAKISFLAKKMGIAFILRKLGILKAISPTLHAADLFLKDVSMKFLSDRPEAQKYLERTFVKKETEFFEAQHKFNQLTKKGQPISNYLKAAVAGRPTRPKVALLPVCGSQYLRSSIAVGSVRVLSKLKIDFIIPETICCGLPAASAGMIDGVKKIALENIQELERARFETIITDDSSCTAHFKDYAKYFQDDPITYEKAHTLSQKMREFSAFLIQYGILDLLKKTKWTGGPVAYHDPCKAQYGQKIVQPPRQILSAIPGLELVSVLDADQCCGGGGSYCVTHPEMSQDVLEAKIKNIISTKCRWVVTSSASCLAQLEFGLRQKQSQIKALHLSEFLSLVLTTSS